MLLRKKLIPQKDLQNQDQNKLYTELKNIVPKNVLTTKNKAKSWTYGYNEKYNFVVISKTGQIEDVINVSGLNIALPKIPKEVFKRSNKKEDQYCLPTVFRIEQKQKEENKTSHSLSS